MKHEILLACIGYTGDLIEARGTEGGRVKMQLKDDIQFLDKSEKDVIGKIITLGAAYLEVNTFISKTKIKQINSIREAKHSGGMYMKSFVTGLEEVLDEYRSKIVEVEQDLIQEPNTPLSHLLRTLNAYTLILPNLATLVYEITLHELYGGPLLDALYKHSCTGIAAYKNCVDKLRSQCHAVMFNQLAAWILHGILADQYDEFFIIERDASINKTSISNSKPSSLYRGGALPGTKRNRTNSLSDFTSREVDPVAGEHEWNTQFMVRVDMLPLSYIPVRVAEKALFIGKAVHVLQRTEEIIQETLLPPSELDMFSETLIQLKSTPIFHLLSLEIFLDKVRAAVAKALWTVVVEVAKFPLHLQALKDFFLLANGEFYQSFIDESRYTMSLPPTVNAERDINAGPFTVAAINLGIEDDAFFKRFSLRLDAPEFRYPHFNSVTAIKNLNLVGNTVNYVPSETAVGMTSLNVTSATNNGSNGESCIAFGSSKTGSGGILSNGSLWYSYPKSVDRGFSTKFRFQCGSEGAGIAFVIQFDRGTALGVSKEALGYQGIVNSVAVEFDCGNNGCEPHVAVHSRGALPNSTQSDACLGAAPLPRGKLHDDAIHSVRIDYDYINDKDRIIKVFWLDPSNATSNNEPILTVPINIGKTITLEVTGKAFVGFTSSLKSSSSPDHVDSVSNAVQLFSWAFKSTTPAASSGSNGQDAWRSIGLNYRVSWPLHLIVTNHALSQYSNLFQYIFTVKRVSCELQRAWASITQRQYKTMASKDTFNLTPMWSLRARMAFFVDNLQFYLQVDVIDSQYQELQKKIAESKDFETVKAAHEQYLNAISSQSFLRSTMIRRALDDIFRVCLQFCSLLNKFGDDLTKVSLSEVATLTKDFDRYLCFLFSLIARLNTQLVLRLDFNGFLSSQSLQIGGASASLKLL